MQDANPKVIIITLSHLTFTFSLAPLMAVVTKLCYNKYVRQFEVPEGFDVTGLQIQAGMIDEADEVFLNGVRVGQTGIPTEGGSYDGSNPWDEERIYPIPDEGIASGEIPPCIVIFPSDSHPVKESWWSGIYADMLNEDLIAQVDGTLRTVGSRDYRFLAGESMGGAGAYMNALQHPELYAGVFDIYGGLRYNTALDLFLRTDAEELSKLRHYIICGNHDTYGFDTDHIMMGKYLSELGVPYKIEIDDGGHESDFYLPRIKDGLAYLLKGIEPVN